MEKFEKAFMKEFEASPQEKYIVYFNLKLLETNEREIWYPTDDVIRIKLSYHLRSPDREAPVIEKNYYLVERDKRWTFDFIENQRFVMLKGSYLSIFKRWVQDIVIEAWDADNQPKDSNVDGADDGVV